MHIQEISRLAILATLCGDALPQRLVPDSGNALEIMRAGAGAIERIAPTDGY